VSISIYGNSYYGVNPIKGILLIASIILVYYN